MVKAGKFEATVSDYGTGKSKTGKDFVWIYFKTPEGNVKWTGYLSPAALENTIKALVIAGCTDLGGIAEGNPTAFDKTVKVSITVEHEADQSDSTKIYAKVKYINSLTKPRDAALVAQGRSVLDQYQGQFMAAKQKLGVSTQSPTSTAVGF